MTNDDDDEDDVNKSNDTQFTVSFWVYVLLLYNLVFRCSEWGSPSVSLQLQKGLNLNDAFTDPNKYRQ